MSEPHEPFHEITLEQFLSDLRLIQNNEVMWVSIQTGCVRHGYSVTITKVDSMEVQFTPSPGRLITLAPHGCIIQSRNVQKGETLYQRYRLRCAEQIITIGIATTFDGEEE